MKMNNTQGAIIMADFMKAFDVVNINFVKETLSTFNFGPQFITWVSVLYEQAVSSVLVNGFLTD